MMGLFIGLLTVVMVVDCLILIFLVLIQLPKKDAGAGLAFGASATDALFGAGSGTVLTKITKYAAGAFFVMAIFLSVLQSNYHRRSARQFGEALGAAPVTLPQSDAAAKSPAVGTNAATLGSATNSLPRPMAENTNVPTVTNGPIILPNKPPGADAAPKQ